MKKLLLIILAFSLLTVTVSAEENSWLKLQFDTVPESPVAGAGWINLKDIADTSENVSVTIYNGGEDAFAAFISGRDKDWTTVCKTEPIYIESGESEIILLEDIDSSATKFMLELRELYAGVTVYIKGKEMDYSSITTLSTDLGDHFTLTASEIEASTPEVTEAPASTPVQTNAPTPLSTIKPTEMPSLTPESTAIYEPEDIFVTVTTLVTVSAITAFAGVVVGGLLVFFVMKKNKKG